MTSKQTNSAWPILSSLAILTILFLSSCVYDAPLTEENKIPIDEAIVGLWGHATKDKEESDPGPELMILKYSDTEYLVHYPANKKGFYFRGYPIKISGVSCVQLEVIGTSEGRLKEDFDSRFRVMSYQVTDQGLVIRELNDDLVNSDLKTSEELRKAFVEHKDHEFLFTKPQRFEKVEN